MTDGLLVGEVTCEYMKQERPMNGSQANVGLKRARAAIQHLREKTVKERDEIVQRYQERIAERRAQYGNY